MLRSWFVLATVMSISSSAYAQASALRLAPELVLSIAQLPPLAATDSYAAVDPRPSSGMGLIIAGWIMTGLGMVNLATIPVCYADFYPDDAREVCAVASGVLGGVLLAVGIPFLIIGYGKRSDYKAWRERHGGATAELLKLHVSLERNGALLSYRAEL